MIAQSGLLRSLRARPLRRAGTVGRMRAERWL